MLILSNCFEVNKLEHAEATLEKTVKGILQKNVKILEMDLVEFYETAESLRHQQQCCLNKQLKDIVKSLKAKKEVLNRKQFNQIKDFDQFKAEMVDTQDKIVCLKRDIKTRFAALLDLQNDLDDELNLYFNGKVAAWGQHFNIGHFDLIPPRIKHKNSGQCKDVKQFFDFVHESGGHENGWRREDHLLFQKFRNKYKKVDDLAYHLHEILPDIPEDDIKQHDEWYKKYLALNLRKKEAIKKWRKHKTNESAVRRSASCKTALGKDVTTEEPLPECVVLKEKLMHWKTEREDKLLREREIEKERALEKIEKERLKKRRHFEMKKLVTEWRESKETLEDSRKLQQKIFEEIEQKRRASNANKMIKRFQSMDETHISKMREIHKKSAEEPKKRAQSGPAVFRDSKRLMRPTAQWIQRVRAVREPESKVPVYTIPKLAVPEWRQSIN